METDRFVIRWRSKLNGMAGKGSKSFGQEEARSLAKELNDEYPEMIHDVIPAVDETIVGTNPEEISPVALEKIIPPPALNVV